MLLLSLDDEDVEKERAGQSSSSPLQSPGQETFAKLPGRRSCPAANNCSHMVLWKAVWGLTTVSEVTLTYSRVRDKGIQRSLLSSPLCLSPSMIQGSGPTSL